GTLADPLAQLGAHALDAALADLVGADQRVTLGAGDDVVGGAAARPAHAELIQLAALEEAFIDRVANRRAMVEIIAPHGRAAEIEMRVEMDHRERAHMLGERAQHGQRNRVIATDDERGDLRGYKLANLGLDHLAHRAAIEWRK